jgi:hypothetical protein
MSLIDRVVNAIGPKAEEQKIPGQAVVALTDTGRAGPTNVKLFRHWAQTSELVRGAIDIRRGQVAVAEWDILPNDPEQTYSKALQARIKRVFDTPNPTRNSFRNFAEPVLEDILVLDAGSIEKVRSLRGEIAQIWYVDGGEVRVAKYWEGDPDIPRYFWYPDGQVRAAWRNEDFTYIMSRPATHRVVGLSTMEILKMTIDRELGADAYNSRQVNSAAPDGMLDLGEGVPPDKVDKFRSYWLTEIAGKGAMAIIGGSKGAKFLPFRISNREMQFSEWQNYLLRKTALVFQLSPMDLNAVSDVNRATGNVLQENTEDRGLRPLLGLFADYLTREIVWDEGWGGPDNNLKFAFTKLNLKESLDIAKIYQIQSGGMPTRAVNELRKKDGLEPWAAEFDKPMLLTSQGVVILDQVPSAGDAAAAQKPTPPPDGGGTKAIEMLAGEIPEMIARTVGAAGDRFSAQTFEQLAGIQPVIDVLRADRTASDRRFEAATVASDSRMMTAFGKLAEVVRAIGARPIEVQVDAPVTVEKTEVHVDEGAIQLSAPVTVERTEVHIDKDAVRVDAPVSVTIPKTDPVVRETTFQTDADGRIIGKTEVEKPVKDGQHD